LPKLSRVLLLVTSLARTLPAMPLVANGLPTIPDAASTECEHGASPQDIAEREAAAADDLFCYVTCSGIDEAVLGLGLQVHARSAHQRRSNLPPELDLVCDYLDVEAFNDGTEHAASKRSYWDETCTLPAMVSSSRKPLNGWLPLYINAEHWSRARCYVASAFNLLMGRKLEAKLRPKDALNICCSLLTCAVVGFTKGQTECASPRSSARGKASERAVQMYADVHRLMLQLAKEHPEIRCLAESRLQKFIESPSGRTRDATPSLGDLIHCLLISETYAWEDLAETLIPEALRRQVLRQHWNGNAFSCQDVSTMDLLISSWNDFAPLSGMVACCCVMFCKRVGRPDACSLAEVETSYDRRWGRLHKDVISDLVSICAELGNQTSVSSFFALAFPGSPPIDDAPGGLGELMLWAEKYGNERIKESLAEQILWAERFGWVKQPIPEEEWPQLHGPYPLLQQWRNRQLRAPRRARQQQTCRRQQYEDWWQQDWSEADPQYASFLQWLPTSRHRGYWQEANYWAFEAYRGVPQYEGAFVRA